MKLTPQSHGEQYHVLQADASPIAFCDAGAVQAMLPNIDSRVIRGFTQEGLLLSQRLIGSTALAPQSREQPSTNRWSTAYISRVAPTIDKLGPEATTRSQQAALSRIAERSEAFVKRVIGQFRASAVLGAEVDLIPVDRAANLIAVVPRTLRRRGMVEPKGMVQVSRLLESVSWQHLSLDMIQGAPRYETYPKLQLLNGRETADMLNYGNTRIYDATMSGLLLAVHLSPRVNYNQKKRGDFRYPLPYVENLAKFMAANSSLHKPGMQFADPFAAFVNEHPNSAGEVRQAFIDHAYAIATPRAGKWNGQLAISSMQAGDLLNISRSTLSNYFMIDGPNTVLLEPYLAQLCWHHATFTEEGQSVRSATS